MLDCRSVREEAQISSSACAIPTQLFRRSDGGLSALDSGERLVFAHSGSTRVSWEDVLFDVQDADPADGQAPHLHPEVERTSDVTEHGHSRRSGNDGGGATLSTASVGHLDGTGPSAR